MVGYERKKPIVQQKTFMAHSMEEMDKKCNEFRKANPLFKFLATQTHIIDTATNKVFYATVFWEIWE